MHNRLMKLLLDMQLYKCHTHLGTYILLHILYMMMLLLNYSNLVCICVEGQKFKDIQSLLGM